MNKVLFWFVIRVLKCLTKVRVHRSHNQRRTLRQIFSAVGTCNWLNCKNKNYLDLRHKHWEVELFVYVLTSFATFYYCSQFILVCSTAMLFTCLPDIPGLFIHRVVTKLRMQCRLSSFPYWSHNGCEGCASQMRRHLWKIHRSRYPRHKLLRPCKRKQIHSWHSFNYSVVPTGCMYMSTAVSFSARLGPIQIYLKGNPTVLRKIATSFKNMTQFALKRQINQGFTLMQLRAFLYTGE